MKQSILKRLSELGSQLDSVEVCGERFDLIHNIPSNELSIDVVRLLFHNLSTSPENSQWTMDESTIGVIESAEPIVWIEGFWREFDFLARNATYLNRSHCHYFISRGAARYEKIMVTVFDRLEDDIRHAIVRHLDDEFLRHYSENPEESVHCWGVLNHLLARSSPEKDSDPARCIGARL